MNHRKEGSQIRYHEFAPDGRSSVIALWQAEEGRIWKDRRALPRLGETRIKFSYEEEAGHGHRRQSVRVGLAILSQCAQGIEVSLATKRVRIADERRLPKA